VRRISGFDVTRILEHFSFGVLTQRGSYVKLRRLGTHGQWQTTTVPRHCELDTRTLRAVLRQACQCVPEEELREHFDMA